MRQKWWPKGVPPLKGAQLDYEERGLGNQKIKSVKRRVRKRLRMLVEAGSGRPRRHELSMEIHIERVRLQQKHINFQPLGQHGPTSLRRRCRMYSFKEGVLGHLKNCKKGSLQNLLYQEETALLVWKHGQHEADDVEACNMASFPWGHWIQWQASSDIWVWVALLHVSMNQVSCVVHPLHKNSWIVRVGSSSQAICTFITRNGKMRGDPLEQMFPPWSSLSRLIWNTSRASSPACSSLASWNSAQSALRESDKTTMEHHLCVMQICSSAILSAHSSAVVVD